MSNLTKSAVIVGFSASVLLFLCTATAQTKYLESNTEKLVACATEGQLALPATSAGFAKANLVSLWYARLSVDKALNEMKGNEDNPISQLTGMMRSTKVSTNEFICAKRAIRSFSKDKNENIRIAAQFLLSNYDAQIALNIQLLGLLRDLDPNTSPATLADKLSTLQVERGQLWKDLINPTQIALMSLVDLNRTDAEGQAVWLTLSKRERGELLGWLKEHFPELKDGELDWNDPKLTEPTKIASLYITLFDKRKCSDE